MQSKTFALFLVIAMLSACQEKKHGLNPVVNLTDTFSLVQKRIYHLKDMSRVETVRIRFSLQFLRAQDSSSIFRFAFNRFELDPVPPYLQQVANFDSLGSAIASSPYEVTVNSIGSVIDIKGEANTEHRVSGAFTSSYIARSFTADYFSSNAVTDMLNRYFSTIPHRAIAKGDQWVREMTLITKAPVKISNLFTCESVEGDSAFLQNFALISADQGDVSTVYMKGEQSGEVVISSVTGMASLYKTYAKTVTTTVAGENETEEFFEIRKLH